MKDSAALAARLNGKVIAEAQIDEELFLRFTDGAILRVSAPYRLLSDHHHSPEQALISRSVAALRTANGFLHISFGPMIELAVDIRNEACHGEDALVLHSAGGEIFTWK